MMGSAFDFGAVNEALASVESVDARCLADESIGDALVGLEGLRRRLEMVEARVIAHGEAVRFAHAQGQPSMARWLRSQLLLSAAEAKRRTLLSEVVTDRVSLTGEPIGPVLPNVAAGFARGELTRDHVLAIGRCLAKLPVTLGDEALGMAERQFAQLAPTLTPDDMPVLLDRIRGHVDPDGDAITDTDRKRQRSLSCSRPDADGMVAFRGNASAADFAAIAPLFHAMTKPGVNNRDLEETDGYDDLTEVQRNQADRRTGEQRAYDALLTLAEWVARNPVIGTSRGVPVTIIATMTVQQIITGTGVAVLATGERVAVADLFARASSVTPYLALLSPQSRPLDLYRGPRVASTDQRFALFAGELGCTAPGCDIPFVDCEIHHRTEWADGGETNIDNLTTACPGHHARVNTTEFGWDTTAAPPDHPFAGRTIWTHRTQQNPEPEPGGPDPGWPDPGWPDPGWADPSGGANPGEASSGAASSDRANSDRAGPSPGGPKPTRAKRGLRQRINFRHHI